MNPSGTRESATAGLDAVANKAGLHFAPAFIVGVPRSGTTLLVNLVGAHSALAPIYETRFLRNLMVLCQRLCWFHGASWSRRSGRVLGESWIKAHFNKELAAYRSKAIKYNQAPRSSPDAKRTGSLSFGGQCIRYEMAELIYETDRWLERIAEGPLSCADVYRTAREYVDKLFAIHCARMNKPYWVNKTPGLLAYLELLHKLYPGSACMHIIRDGRDVVASNQALGWGPKDVGRAARRWKSLIHKGRAGAARAKLRYKELRYEKLVAAPRESMREVAQFLGLDSDSDALAESISVSKERQGRWRTAWSLRERRDFAGAAGDLLIELGYEKSDDWLSD
jgi:hypothetical protein